MPQAVVRASFHDPTRNAGIAYIDAAGGSIHAMPDTGEPYWQNGTMPPVVPFPTAAPVIALGNLQQLPLWVVSGATPGSFRLFYGSLDAGDSPLVHEIPYPFASGTRPRLIQSSPSVSAVLVDQSPVAPYDILIAVIVLRADSTVRTATFHASAPPGTVSIVGTTTEFTDSNADVWEQQLVVFFEDPGSFVSFRIAQPYPDLQLGSDTSAYQLSEIARGAWPYHVISATTFNELCTTYSTPEPSEFRNPTPLAVLTSDGDILVHQFNHPLGDGETFPQPYATPGPTARVLGTVDMYGVWGVWALTSDGKLVMYGDSDCTNLESTALAPLVFDLGPGSPLSVDDRGIAGLGRAPEFEFVLGRSYFSDVFGQRDF